MKLRFCTALAPHKKHIPLDAETLDWQRDRYICGGTPEALVLHHGGWVLRRTLHGKTFHIRAEGTFSHLPHSVAYKTGMYSGKTEKDKLIKNTRIHLVLNH